MMLGNLLGHIDALLSDNIEDSFSQIKAAVPQTPQVSDYVDKRKDLSHELCKNIDSYICDLDNDLSITNDPSYLEESLELSKGELNAVSAEEPDAVEIATPCLQTEGNPADNNHLPQSPSRQEEMKRDVCTADAGSKISEMDPFLDKNQLVEHEFVINSPFCKQSVAQITPGSASSYQASFSGNDGVCGEIKSTTIDDFKGFKAEMDSILNESNNIPVLDLLNEEFQSADDISDIFSNNSDEETKNNQDDLGAINNHELMNAPSTPRSSIPPVDLLMSPGQFFSQKSGNLGHLGTNKNGVERPLWYTPKTDPSGCVLDPIEATPTDSHKLLQTPKGSRLVRPPLYSSPSSRLYQESMEKIEKNILSSLDSINNGSEKITKSEVKQSPNQALQNKSVCDDDSVNSTDCKRMEITFPSVKYRNESRISISINNPTSKDAFWTIRPVGSPYVVIESQNPHPVDDMIFRFIQNKGKVQSGSDIALSISFFPLIAGIYTQTFHLRVQSHVLVLELKGESLHPNSESKRHSRRSLPQNNHTIRNHANTPNHSGRPGTRLVQTEPKNRFLHMDRSSSRILTFGTTRLRNHCQMQIQVCNNRIVPSQFKFYISGPFSIPAEKLCINSKSYVDFPIAFIPTHEGKFKGSLLIKSEMGDSEKITLLGKCHK